MIRMDYAREADIPALKALWKAVFKDTDSYIDGYFNSLFSEIRIAVYRAKNGKPISMISMLPVTLKIGRHRYPGHYIYAAATAKRYEGQGLMTALLEFACQTAEARGDHFSCLIPATEGLFRFYEKRGYQTAFYRDILHFPSYDAAEAAPTEWTVLSPLDFQQRRTAFAEKQETVILQQERLYPYIYTELQESGMETLLVRSGAAEGYVVCYAIDDLLAVKETSLTREELKAALLALERHFGCRDAIAAFPTAGGEGCRPYGMLRPLKELPDLTGKYGYMGLLMD